MKKLLLFLLGVVMVVGITGCSSSGGDDDSPYDFGGHWVASYVVIQSNLPGYPVGRTGTGPANIVQNGTALTVTLGTQSPMAGTCDPEAGTFSVSHVVGSIAQTMNGHAVDEDTMSGEVVLAGGPYVVRQSWTMQLSSRVAAMPKAAAPAQAVKTIEDAIKSMQ